MTDILIRDRKEWERCAKTVMKKDYTGKDVYFVEHTLAGEFALWAIKRSMTRGFFAGFVSALVLCVVIAGIVRLMH